MRKWNSLIIGLSAAILAMGMIKVARGEVCINLGGGIIKCPDSGTTIIVTTPDTVIVKQEDRK